MAKQLILLFEAPLNVPIREKTDLICISSTRRIAETLRWYLARGLEPLILSCKDPKRNRCT